MIDNELNNIMGLVGAALMVVRDNDNKTDDVDIELDTDKDLNDYIIY